MPWPLCPARCTRVFARDALDHFLRTHRRTGERQIRPQVFLDSVSHQGHVDLVRQRVITADLNVDKNDARFAQALEGLLYDFRDLRFQVLPVRFARNPEAQRCGGRRRG